MRRRILYLILQTLHGGFRWDPCYISAAMNLKRNLPYILASALLLLLIGMAQSKKTVIRYGASSVAQAEDEKDNDYFFLPEGATPVSDITKADYENIVMKFTAQNFLSVFQQTGKPLLIPHEWESPFFAAFAKSDATLWQISMWGGMARAPGSSQGALAAILCHELGHIVGGEPRQTIPGAEWASSEGQSDFYAAAVCLPKFLSENPQFVPVVSPVAQDLCQKNSLCGKIMQAGLDMVSLFQKYSYRDYTPVSLDLSAPAVPELLRNTYPSDQCRLDTFKAGALCQLGGACVAPACWFP